MLTMKPLFPVRCIVSGDLWPTPEPADRLPPESPVRDAVVEPRFVVVRKPGCRPRVALVIYEDTLLMEAKLTLWTCANGRAEGRRDVRAAGLAVGRQS